MTLTFYNIKNKEEFRQKIILAKETKKALERLMFDLREARENTILDVRPDGLWHRRIAFIRAHQGVLEYTVKKGHLLRLNKGKEMLVADHIGDFCVRRQKGTPDILEVQIKAQDRVSLTFNLRVKILHH